MKDRQQRRDELEAHLAARSAVSKMCSRRSIESKIHERLKAWQKRLSTADVQTSRQCLREILTGPIRFIPEGQAYRFEGELDFGAVFSGVTAVAGKVASPTGFEPVFWP